MFHPDISALKLIDALAKAEDISVTLDVSQFSISPYPEPSPYFGQTPVTGASDTQAAIAILKTALLGMGVTGVTPSDRNCAEAGDTARTEDRIATDKTAKMRCQNFCIFLEKLIKTVPRSNPLLNMFDPFKRPQFGPGLHVTLKKPRCI